MSEQPMHLNAVRPQSDRVSSDPGFQRFGGGAAFLLALTSITYSILFIFLPVAQKQAPAQALPDFALHPTLRLIMQADLALGGIAGTAAAVAIYQRVREQHPGWALWSMLLGVVGSSVTVLDAIYFAYFLLALSRVYTLGDPVTKAAALTVGIIPSPVGLGNDLLVGPWLIVTGLLMARSSYFPRLLGYIAAVGGLSLLAVVLVGLLGHIQGVLSPLFVAGAAIGGPIFFLWAGFILWTKQ